MFRLGCAYGKAQRPSATVFVSQCYPDSSHSIHRCRRTTRQATHSARRAWRQPSRSIGLYRASRANSARNAAPLVKLHAAEYTGELVTRLQLLAHRRGHIAVIAHPSRHILNLHSFLNIRPALFRAPHNPNGVVRQSYGFFAYSNKGYTVFECFCPEV